MDSVAMQSLLAQHAGSDGQLNIGMEDLVKVLSSAINTETAVSKKGTKRSAKKERDPNKPKQPKTAYFLWSETVRSETRSKLQEVADEGHKVRVGEVSKELSKLWKVLSDEDKKPFEDQAKEASEQYAIDIAAYRAENGITTTVRRSTKFDAETAPDAPNGWSGPHDGYLELTVKDPETGKTHVDARKSYHSFDEAIAVAERLGAGGITRTPAGFKIRAAKAVSINASSREKNEISWIFESSPVVPQQPAKKHVVKKAAPIKVATPEPVRVATPEPIKAATPEPVKVATPEPETDDDDTEEIEETVEEFEHKGTTYLKDSDGYLFPDDDECTFDQDDALGVVKADGSVEIY